MTYHFGKSVQQRHHKFEKKSGALRGYLKEAAGGQKGVEKEGVFYPLPVHHIMLSGGLKQLVLTK